MRQSPETRLKRAERDLARAEVALERASHWARLAVSRGDLLHEHERAAWKRCEERVLRLRARVEIRKEVLARAQKRRAAEPDPLGYIELDEQGKCPHAWYKGLGCPLCDPLWPTGVFKP